VTFSWILMNIRSQVQLLRSCQRCRQFLKRMEWLMPAMHRCAAFTYFWHYVLSCSPSALALSFCITKIIRPVVNYIPAISTCRRPHINSKFEWLNKKRHQFLYYMCLKHMHAAKARILHSSHLPTTKWWTVQSLMRQVPFVRPSNYYCY